MPLDLVSEELAKETVEMLQRSAKDILRPVLISPMRMKALRDAAAMRMTMNINGLAIQVVESRDAEQSIEANIAAAIAPEDEEPKPAGEHKLQAGNPCTECGGRTVRLEDGDVMCVRCRCIQVTNTPVSDKDAQRAARLVLERSPVAPGSAAAVQLASERHNGRS